MRTIDYWWEMLYDDCVKPHENGDKMMISDTEKILDTLIRHLSDVPDVSAIGISGSKTPLPKAGEGDIDVFIYCDQIPDVEVRRAAIAPLGDQIQVKGMQVFEGGHWGVGDLVLIHGVETWLMYFTRQETILNTEAILNGDHPDKLDNYYYPIGRLGMLKNLTILSDKHGFLATLKERLACYPNELARQLTVHHLDALEDTEDLLRAVGRKDVLFYHFALDLALDHFLQALFALNRVYFPSRKRSFEFVNDFKIKPTNCSEKLLEVIRLGGTPGGIEASYILWQNLVDRLKALESDDYAE